MDFKNIFKRPHHFLPTYISKSLSLKRRLDSSYGQILSPFNKWYWLTLAQQFRWRHWKEEKLWYQKYKRYMTDRWKKAGHELSSHCSVSQKMPGEKWTFLNLRQRIPHCEAWDQISCLDIRGKFYSLSVIVPYHLKKSHVYIYRLRTNIAI